MESSITSPVHKTRANSVIRFNEKPQIFRKINVDKIEIGTVMNGIRVLLKLFKNSSMIKATKNIAKHRVKITSLSASETKIDVS